MPRRSTDADALPAAADLPVGEPVPPASDVQAPGRPGRRVFEGRFVRLVPVVPGDADELWPAAHGADADGLWTYLPYGPFPDAAAMRAWITVLADGEDPLFFCVRRAEDDAAIGMVSFLGIEPEHRCVELGHIWYVPAAQRTRANTEAVLLLLEEAFDRRCCRRVEWKCDSLNARSRAAAGRLGFTFEGIFRQHRIVRGRNRDTAWFALLDGDWPDKRANLRRWLYDNDSGGLSLTRLNGADGVRPVP